MKFVNYNLPHMRETKDRSLDKESLVEPPLSEESGSVKNDISIHVPIFREKIDGRWVLLQYVTAILRNLYHIILEKDMPLVIW